MAIYHMQAKVVSRGSGRSAVAASAYMSCKMCIRDSMKYASDISSQYLLIPCAERI